MWQERNSEAANNSYAAALHRSFEQRACAVVAFDNNQFDRAYWHFVAAAIFKPAAPNASEISTTERIDRIAAAMDAIRLDPKNAKAHYDLGLAFDSKGDSPGAIASFKKAIRLDPHNSPPYHNLGNALASSGDFDGAIAAYKEAIRLNRNFSRASYYRLGNALLRKKLIDEAITAYNDAIALSQSDAPAFNGLGNALLGKKDFDRAIIAFKEAIRFDPKFTEVYNCLGSVLLDPYNGYGETLNQRDEPVAALQVLRDGAKLAPAWMDDPLTGARYNSALCRSRRYRSGQRCAAGIGAAVAAEQIVGLAGRRRCCMAENIG